MRRNMHNLGFTLMELVLVLAVIAICAAIAAPTLRGFAKGRLLPNTATELVTTAALVPGAGADRGRGVPVEL